MPDFLARLTARERQIVALVVTGLTNKGVARQLKVGECTVKMHLHHVYQKLQIENRTALTAAAFGQPLVRLCPVSDTTE